MRLLRPRFLQLRGPLSILAVVVIGLTVCQLATGAEAAPHQGARDSSSTSSRRQESQAMRDLRKVFGINHVPVYSVKRIAPQYMTDLFSSINHRDGTPKTSTPFNSNVIRGLADQNVTRQTQYFYDVSLIEADETVIEAEFHLYRLRPDSTMLNDSHGRLFPKPAVVTLQLYQILNENRPLTAHDVRLIAARRLSTAHHQAGWEIFNVTETVREWRRWPESNHGFMVVVSRSLPTSVPSNEIPYRFAQRNNHHGRRQPIVVVYTDSPSTRLLGLPKASSSDQMLSEHPEVLDVNDQLEGDDQAEPDNDVNEVEVMPSYRQFRRVNRTTESGASVSHRRSKRSANNRAVSRGTYETGQYYKKQSFRSICSKTDMYVDFDEIGWSDWIISPKGYNAYYCKGTCIFPLDKNTNPTNHATVQGIVQALTHRLSNIPNPCCVPDKLTQISLLYFDEKENVILKKYEDMVVKTCGCR